MTDLPHSQPNEADEAGSERDSSDASVVDAEAKQGSIRPPTDPVEHARFLLAAREPADGTPIDPDEERRRVKKLLFDTQREARRLGIPTADDRELPVYESPGTLAHEIREEAAPRMAAANRRADLDYVKVKEKRADGSSLEVTRLRIDVFAGLFNALKGLAAAATTLFRGRFALRGKVGRRGVEIETGAAVEVVQGETPEQRAAPDNGGD